MNDLIFMRSNGYHSFYSQLTMAATTGGRRHHRQSSSEMAPERHGGLILRVFLPTCMAQDRGPTWWVFGRWGDRSRARDHEVLPQGFGGINPRLPRSAGVVACLNRRGAVPRSSLRVRYCLDGRASVWRQHG
jgi:hypothetical protein